MTVSYNFDIQYCPAVEGAKLCQTCRRNAAFCGLTERWMGEPQLKQDGTCELYYTELF